MTRLYIAVLICLTLTACATTANYEKVLASWVGSSEDNLVRSWGPPDSVYEGAGSKYLTYMRASQGYVPGVAPTYQSNVIGNTVYTQAVGGSPGYTYNTRCKTVFELVGGTITSWRWEGNACRSR